LTEVIKREGAAAPNFTGMARKPANTDLRVEAQSVEKNRRRLRTRKPPAPIQPLGIDAATQCRMREIIALAEAAPVTAAEFKAALAKWPPPARLAPLSLVVMPFGYRVIFAIETSDGPARRRLSLSHPSDPPALQMQIGLLVLAEEFGLARGVDYISWCEVEGTACWFLLAGPV
jgi:hypothetical protein